MYTFLVEYRGGTYISQLPCDTLDKSISEWSKTLVAENIKYLGPLMKKEIAILLKDEEPVKIKGVNNVWLLMLCLKTGTMLIHIIKTADYEQL
jgi:hypothetical protein